MKIDGKTLAQNILVNIKNEVKNLKKKGIVPRLAILMTGDDPASMAYIKQKEKKAQTAGIQITSLHFPETASQEIIMQSVQSLSGNPHISGVIIQRPLPEHIDNHLIDLAVDPQKDVDGFLENSPFIPPIVRAVVRILEETLRSFGTSFDSYFSRHSLVIIGKGKTAGTPLINYFRSKGIEPIVVDSNTKNANETTRKADVIISAVGKADVVKAENIKKGCVLIGVGMHRNHEGKLAGDFDEEKIKDIAGAYTPTPGGVGPMNVTMLLENVLQSAKNQQSRMRN